MLCREADTCRLYTCTYILCKNEFQVSYHCPQVSPHGVENNVTDLHQAAPFHQGFFQTHVERFESKEGTNYPGYPAGAPARELLL